jgi:opacity protein-like surface antigen
LALAAWLASSPAIAGGPAPFNWSGFYLGFHTGGALALPEVGDPFGPSLFGDGVRTPGPLAGGQLGYNWQFGSKLLGLEADGSFADLDGTNSCFAFSGFYLSANCRASIEALGTLTGRFGFVLPSDGRTLLYGKAGLAWAHGALEAIPNAGLGLANTRDGGTQWGWTVGAGLERAIAPRWTVKAEYAFLAFDESIVAPASQFQHVPPLGALTAFPSARAGISQDVHVFKLGMNYRLSGAASASNETFPHEAPISPTRTEIQAGARYVHGWGQFHKDLGIPGLGIRSLASRLTYETDGVDGAEAFARLDAAFGLMVKGMAGGASSGGRLNDEDWGIPFPTAEIPYSNTISAVDNDIDYWTLDAGYDVWRGTHYKIAPFVGYTRFSQDMKGLGCRQIADPYSDCGTPIPVSTLAIEEKDVWRAVRLGAAADLAVAPRLTLTADAAYLPHVEFKGTDNHVLRSLLSPERGDGRGVQLEASLSYALTKAFDLGIGGRYWSMWTTDGIVNFGGTGQIVPMRYAAEQAQIFLQGSYKFGVGR